MKTTQKILIVSIVLVLASPILIPVGLMMLGYHVNVSGKQLAERLVKESRPVTECRKIWFMPWRQYASSVEHHLYCIHEYASLAKDPSACELLMPSDYGWSCLGAAEKPDARICWFDFGKNATQIGGALMPDCGGREDSLAHRCCDMAKSLYVQKNTSCDIFKDSIILHDQCLELMAKRDRNSHLCTYITNEHVRSACEVQVRAL